MTPAWKQYEEEAAGFFCELGMRVDLQARCRGARTTHDVDVLVRSSQFGLDITWVVECKNWQSAISKLHVIALREIVSDLGADRGIIVSESGFQSGAHEAAQLTNIQLTSLSELRKSASAEVGMARLRQLQERVDSCRSRYWELPKQLRIDVGLRHDVMAPGYSLRAVLDSIDASINEAAMGRLPIRVGYVGSFLVEALPADSTNELADKVEELLREGERLLRAGEEEQKLRLN